MIDNDDIYINITWKLSFWSIILETWKASSSRRMEVWWSGGGEIMVEIEWEGLLMWNAVVESWWCCCCCCCCWWWWWCWWSWTMWCGCGCCSRISSHVPWAAGASLAAEASPIPTCNGHTPDRSSLLASPFSNTTFLSLIN